MRRVAFVLVFLALVAEGQMMYAKRATTPLRVLDQVLFEASPLKLPLFGFIVLALLVLAHRRAKEPPVAHMRRAITISVGAIALWAVMGLLTGGVFKQLPFQIYPLMVMSLFGLLLLDVVRTPAHVAALGKIIVAAALWRSLCGIVFYWTVVRHITNWEEIPAYVTTHDDTTLFCTAVVLVGLYALHDRRTKTVLFAIGTAAVVLYAIQLNNRRLAWASLIMASVAAYAALPRGPLRRRVNRIALVVAPVLALYVAVGWGRTERIFKPLRALATMDSSKDSSTRSRDVEDNNLMVTVERHPVLGTGFGHPFDVVDATYQLNGVFDQWRYIPHNSYLGLLAFTGALGFAAIWWPLPVSVYLSARACRASKTTVERVASSAAVAEVVIFANQCYGDMGLGSQTGLVLLASAYAVGARIASTSGGW